MSFSPAQLANADQAPRRTVADPALPKGYWLTRFVILRVLGLVYLVAFVVAINQLVPLIGHRGLLPADLYLTRVAETAGSRIAGSWQVPTLFWWNVSDRALLAVSWIGAALSLCVLLGYANAISMALLWVLYTSIVNVGQLWYSYGWEIQLLETGFLAIFLCPLIDCRPFPRAAPPLAVIWLFRWLAFRIMLGAALIKLRGDACWRDLTCLYYHYETQPIPNPLSWWLHFRPHWFQKIGALWNHFVELVVPWFAFWPRPFRHVSGLLLIAFQMTLIGSGNLSFLNWLTIVPCLACLDDTFWVRVLPRFLIVRAAAAKNGERHSFAQTIVAAALALLVAALSIEPVLNLISPGQVMNSSFNRLNLVNTYGAFGSVGRERLEIVFEGTGNATPDFAVWKEYEFKAKPGDPRRRPALISPYQLRLDWQIWFAAMASPSEYPWTIHFVWQLLHNQASTLSLLSGNPFPAAPPRYIRAVLYRYHFTPPRASERTWWQRERLGLWLPPLSTDNPGLRRFIQAAGWFIEEEEPPAK